MAKNIKGKPKSKPTVKCKNCSYVCISPCSTGVNNTAQNSSDNLPSYPTEIIIAQRLSTRGSPGASGSNQNDQFRSTNSQVYIYGLPQSASDRDQIVYSILRSQSIKNKTDRDHEPNS